MSQSDKPRARTFTQRLAVVVPGMVHRGRGEDGLLRRRIFYPLLGLRVLIQVLRQWARDRCPQQAASLAFQTALSIVPMVAIGLALLRATDALEAESTLVEVISKQFLPVSREEISRHLVGWAHNVSFSTAGIAGIVMMLVLSFVMFDSTERIFNDIWRVERRRRLGQKFVVFYALATIVPLLLAFSLYHAARYQLTTGWIGSLGALSATFGALFLANKLLPTMRVGWLPAVWGALVAALAFEGAKHLFRLYVARVAFQKYAGIYGPMGILPILLVWIYVSWLIVLLGAEIAHAAQNLRHLEQLDRRGRTQDAVGELLDKVNGHVALRLYVAVVERWRAGETPLSTTAIAVRYDLAEEVVERIFRRLRERGLVLNVDGDASGYLPAKHPGEVRVSDVLTAFRGADILTARTKSRLDELLAEITRAGQVHAESTTIDDLTRAPGEPTRASERPA